MSRPHADSPMGRFPDFKYGLCDCFDDCDTCCWATFCPCLVLGANVDMMRLRRVVQPTCNQDACLYCCGRMIPYVGPFVGAICHCQIRDRIQLHLNIVNTSCANYFLAAFCGCCALVQEYRSLRDYIESQPPHQAMAVGVVAPVYGGQQQQPYNAPNSPYSPYGEPAPGQYGVAQYGAPPAQYGAQYGNYGAAPSQYGGPTQYGGAPMQQGAPSYDASAPDAPPPAYSEPGGGGEVDFVKQKSFS